MIAILFLFMPVVYTAHAGSLSFSPSTSSVGLGSNFSVNINIDAGSDQVSGTDVWIDYDASALEVQSVTSGTYFPLVNNVPSTGRLYISGVVANQAEYETGSGTVATVVFHTLQTGTYNLTFECDLAATETSKIVKNDENATNVISCNALTNHTATITGAGTTTTTQTTTTTTNSGTLPESGVVENVIQYSTWGILLFAAGVVLRVVAGSL